MALRLNDGLGATWHATLEDDFKSLADDWHFWPRSPSDSFALAPEEGLVYLHPVFERAVTLALCCRKLRADVHERDDFHSNGLDDTNFTSIEICNDAAITRFRDSLAFGFVCPKKCGCRSLLSIDNKICKFIRAQFVVVEMERVEEAWRGVDRLRPRE